jgi:glycosyltransferase involved in cell wall biosynthesis
VSERALSVLMVGDYPPDPTLGSSKVFYKLREEFQALGHTCDIVFGDEIAAPRGRQFGQLVGPINAAKAIGRRLARGRYDVVDAASAEGLWVGVQKKMGRHRGVALICRSNGLEHLNYRRMIDDHHAGLSRKGWMRRIWYPMSRLSQVAAAARAADRLLLLNDVDRRFALEQRWKSADRIDVVPHGVSSRFLAEPVGDAPRGDGLLFCGSWDNTKGVPYLIATLERLHAQGRTDRLTVLGPGVDAGAVLQAFPERVRSFVRVVDRVPEADVVRMYRSHDVLLWLPTYEGFGLVLLEAMSQEMAVVVTPIGCAPGLVRDGVNGMVVPTRDPDAAAAAAVRLMDAPALRRALGAEARRSVAGMTWTATARNTIAVYRRALEAA